ncbi:MAG: hypothetical protein IPK10_18715 [Bacteroidetes bacterium]|nr:hypothetical protein [Bacteroidota bacterium]
MFIKKEIGGQLKFLLSNLRCIYFSFAMIKLNQMKKLNQILSEKVGEGSIKILIEPNHRTSKLLITTTRNLDGTRPENELVRRNSTVK